MEYHITDDIKHILVALLIGVLIGAEREYRSKSAGLRTMILVSLGSCLFTILSVRIGYPASTDRIAANIITGIGFIGGGVIFKDDNRIDGITTATTIWMMAALGMAVGSGHYQEALVSTAAVLVVLMFLSPLQKMLETVNTTRSYRITCAFTEGVMEKYETMFRDAQLKPVKARHLKRDGIATGNWEVHGRKKNHEKIVALLLNDPNITSLEY
jgi:putative Mg2+ transporter-C (MgtC) family protein